MGGMGNIGDNVFHAPSGTYRGVSIRAFDSEERLWRSWWLDGRRPTVIGSSVAGTFKDGVGTLLGEDEVDGRKVRVRSQWSRTHYEVTALGAGNLGGWKNLGHELERRLGARRLM